MKIIKSFFVFLLFVILAVPLVGFFIQKDIFSINSFQKDTQTAGYFSDSVDIDELKERYEKFANGKKQISNRIKVLIVPGHDDKHHGASFNGLREVDLNRELAKNLYEFLIADTNFRVFLASDENGFNDRIEKYIEEEEVGIQDFRTFKKEVTNRLENSGSVELDQYVSHNSAPEEVALVLYGINRYANEEDFDIVLHVHFNDYSGRNLSSEGVHSGISIYVPASQFSNGSASKQFADNLFKRLTAIFSPSTNPVEQAGVIQDSELIAVGAFNSVDPIALLVEYGYIYEPQFADENLRGIVLKELAYQTYVGMKTFFDTKYAAENFPTTLLPSVWERDLVGGEKGDRDALALQALLRIQGLYPPEGNSLKDCPMAGSFGNCTETSLKNFQKKYGLSVTGDLDFETRDFLQGFI